jgi:hypothetical protein
MHSPYVDFVRINGTCSYLKAKIYKYPSKFWTSQFWPETHYGNEKDNELITSTRLSRQYSSLYFGTFELKCILKHISIPILHFKTICTSMSLLRTPKVTINYHSLQSKSSSQESTTKKVTRRIKSLDMYDFVNPWSFFVFIKCSSQDA